MKNKLPTLILAFLPAALFAQPFYEIDAHYGFGASELSYNSVPGFAISVYPVKNFGFSAGIEYSWRWKIKTSKPSVENPAVVDGEGDSLVFKYSIDKYREELFGRILQVPLLLKYNNDSYYTAAGVKIGMVQKAGTKISYEGLKTEGYYPRYDLTLTGPLSQGFGEQKDRSSKTKISSKTLTMLALEGGVKLKLSDNFTLLAGVFADYSFNKGFNRSMPSIIERVEVSKDSASLVANSTWKSWHPWSVGAVVKFSFSSGSKELPTPDPEPPIQPPPETDHNITVTSQPPSELQILLFPDSLLNREADFVFNYPETQTISNDSLHKVFVSQIAEILRANPKMQLHCFGYSEKLLSESVAYETAFQRALNIRYMLTRFYGIEESRIFTYSQGSKSQGYKRAECYLFSTLP